MYYKLYFRTPLRTRCGQQTRLRNITFIILYRRNNKTSIRRKCSIRWIGPSGPSARGGHRALQASYTVVPTSNDILRILFVPNPIADVYTYAI